MHNSSINLNSNTGQHSTTHSSNQNLTDSCKKKSGSISALYLCDTASTKAKKADIGINSGVARVPNAQSMSRRNSLGKRVNTSIVNLNSSTSSISLQQNKESSNASSTTSNNINTCSDTMQAMINSTTNCSPSAPPTTTANAATTTNTTTITTTASSAIAQPSSASSGGIEFSIRKHRSVFDRLTKSNRRV
jgi:peptidoglycan DL-endopeptidase CwlO